MSHFSFILHKPDPCEYGSIKFKRPQRRLTGDFRTHKQRGKRFLKRKSQMALTTRQRRSSPTDLHTTSTDSPYSKLDKPEKPTGVGDRGLGWFLPLVSLGVFRYMSASSNIIHDCDEVFNYWEPLHFLLYKTGFQTWEYR